MPRRKTYHLTPEAEAEVRRRLDEWMKQNGHDDASFARLLDMKAETIKVNMGRADYKTRRSLSDTFLLSAQHATGLKLVEAPPVPSKPNRPIEPALADLLVVFLARAILASGGQLSRLLRRSRSQANRIVKPLVDKGILVREREPAPPSGRTRSVEFIYGLGREGYARAAHQLGRPVRAAFTRKRLQGVPFLTHDLMVTEVALRLELEMHDQVADWATAADCRDDVPGIGGRTAVEPDLLFLLRMPEGPAGRWVEVETGSLGRGAVHEKVRGTEAYYLSARFRRRWQTNRLLILWIGQDDGHAHELREWIGPQRPKLMHYFTSWEWIEPHGIGGPIWLAINGREERHTLFGSHELLPQEIEGDK